MQNALVYPPMSPLSLKQPRQAQKATQMLER